jgi:tRNA A-37 threonylcarbamoyl transferase component Bud32
LQHKLSDYFDCPLTLKTLGGRGAASVFQVEDFQGKPLAVVKVVNWRREELSRQRTSSSPYFQFIPGPERLTREFLILKKLAPRGLSPAPLFLDRYFAVYEYCPGPLLKERFLEEPFCAFKAGWEALKQMHSLGVHHADPGPHNIIESSKGLLFIDFEHSMDESRYDFIHMIAYDYHRYCYHSWRLAPEMGGRFFRNYLFGDDGGLSASVKEALIWVISAIPLDREFVNALGLAD